MGNATVYALLGNVTFDGDLYMSSDYGKVAMTADSSTTVEGVVRTITLEVI